MKYLSTLLLFTFLLYSCDNKKEEKSEDAPKKEKPLTSFIQVSQRMLENAKAHTGNEKILKILAEAPKDSLANELSDDSKKKAFWINIYNGFIQNVLTKDPKKYEDRSNFFKVNQFVISGDSLSFDDVEHGIIRNSKVKWGLGYIPKIFPGDYEKKFRTEKTDQRVHFLLNCGAQSCPPVYIFSGNNFDSEADKVAESYLKTVSEYNAEEEKLSTTPLIKWFRGDFGEKDDDLFPMFSQYGIIPEGKEPKIEYGDYDWSLKLDNFY